MEHNKNQAHYAWLNASVSRKKMKTLKFHRNVLEGFEGRSEDIFGLGSAQSILGSCYEGVLRLVLG